MVRQLAFQTLDYGFLPSLQVWFPDELQEAVSALCFLRGVVCSVPWSYQGTAQRSASCHSVSCMHACMHVLELTVKWTTEGSEELHHGEPSASSFRGSICSTSRRYQVAKSLHGYFTQTKQSLSVFYYSTAVSSFRLEEWCGLQRCVFVDHVSSAPSIITDIIIHTTNLIDSSFTLRSIWRNNHDKWLRCLGNATTASSPSPFTQ